MGNDRRLQRQKYVVVSQHQGREARLYARFYLVTAARNFKFARIDLGMGLDRSQSLKEWGG